MDASTYTSAAFHLAIACSTLAAMIVYFALSFTSFPGHEKKKLQPIVFVWISCMVVVFFLMIALRELDAH